VTNFVLVHGAFHGAWCWERLLPHLKGDKRVEHVVAMDLLGHGARVREKDPRQVTIDDYLLDITKAVTDRDMRNVVLVGHSFSGTFLPEVVARIPDRVKRLVFLAAMTPPEGKTGRETLASLGGGGSRPGATPEQNYRSMFCGDMDEATAQWVLKNLTPVPLPVMDRPVSYRSFPRSVPITYIVFTKDQSIKPAAQHKLLQNLGAPDVLELDAGRDAMITRPQELARLLLTYA